MTSKHELIADDPMIDQFMTEVADLSNNQPPEVLFHYTSADSFLKILQSKSIWMTHILHMNDAVEFAHGLDFFKEGLDLLIAKKVDPTLVNSLKNILEREKQPSVAPYIFCMTANKDQLSQWRAYGDNGLGVSIGFKCSELLSCDALHVKAVNVIYDDTEKRQIVNTAIDKLATLLLALQNEGKNINEDSYIRAIARAYFFAAYIQSKRFKESSWSEEQEWRAVVMAKKGDMRVGARTRGGQIIPYLDCPLVCFQNLLNEVVIGPKVGFELQSQSLIEICVREKLSFSISKSMLSLK